MGRLSWKEYYNEIFDYGVDLQASDGSRDNKANIIAVTQTTEDKPKHKRIIHSIDDIETILSNSFSIISPVTYYGNSPTYKNARECYALNIDIDDVGIDNLTNLLGMIDNDVIPRPTFLINSGRGVHLVYKLSCRCPMYPAMREHLNNIKKVLSEIIWNSSTSAREKREWQHCCQGYRCVGSQTRGLIDSVGSTVVKRTEAFRVGDAVTLTMLEYELDCHLSKIVAPKKKSRNRSNENRLDKAKELYPEWYQRVIVEGQQSRKIPFSRAVYDRFLSRIREECVYGHRYWCIYTLVAFAIKCSTYDSKRNPNPVTYEELRRDAMSLIPQLNQLSSTDPFTEEDVKSALKLYSDPSLASKLTREYLEDKSQIIMPPQKRNHRKQSEHLSSDACRIPRQKGYMDAVREGRVGRKSSKEIILKYYKEHPNADIKQAAKALGIAESTVRKYKPARDVKREIETYINNNENCSVSEIARALKISRPTAIKYRKQIGKII